MHKSILILIAFSSFLFAGCATTPTDDIKIQSEVDPKVNFASFETYTWITTAEILNDPEGRWKQPGFDVDAEIRSLINRELGKRGLSESKSNPDMVVTYVTGINMAALKAKTNPDSNEKIFKNVPQGALVIVLANPVTDYIMWMGTAMAEVQQNPDIEVVKNRLDHAVTKVLEQMPK